MKGEEIHFAQEFFLKIFLIQPQMWIGNGSTMRRRFVAFCCLFAHLAQIQNVSTLFLPPIPQDHRLINIVASGVRRRDITTTETTSTTSTTENPVTGTSPTETEMRRFTFVVTSLDLESRNPFEAEDIISVIFTKNIELCTHKCKWFIGNGHCQYQVNKFDIYLGKCFCYLLNPDKPHFQPLLDDFSWAPKQTRYLYSVHPEKDVNQCD